MSHKPLQKLLAHLDYLQQKEIDPNKANDILLDLTINDSYLKTLKTLLEKGEKLAHEVQGLNIRIDQQWRIADDSRDVGVQKEALEQAEEYLRELQVAAHDLAEAVLG